MGYGSSPRVRGLRAPVLLRHERDRIIPARAGFTRRRRARHTLPADHPRACGVYAPTRSCDARAAGSSPRVRGLLVVRLGGVQDGRIIPARAGFTRATAGRGWRTRDHPRACGVYRRRPRLVVSELRIIPARAGFTPRRTQNPRDTPDHPRACGVYRAITGKYVLKNGSSPRVRGLPYSSDR